MLSQQGGIRKEKEMRIHGGEWRSWHSSSGLADSKALVLGPTMENILSPYQQTDEKIYLLLLLRFCDCHPPLCTCPCHVPGQHRGRTTVHFPLVGSSPASWDSLPSTPTGVLLHLPMALQNSPKFLMVSLLQGLILEPSGMQIRQAGVFQKGRCCKGLQQQRVCFHWAHWERCLGRRTWAGPHSRASSLWGS